MSRFIDYNKTFTTDDLLSSYSSLKTTILTSDFLDLWNKYLSYDKHCDNQCYHCEKLKHLSNDIKLNEPFTVSTGQLVASFLILTSTDINRLSVKKIGSNLCVDSFTGKVLVTWVVEDVFKKLKLPNYLTLHMAWVCQNKGYTLYTAPTINN